MKSINVLLSAFLLGATFGILIGISIKYPARSDSINALNQLCQEHGGWDTTFIGITGKAYTVNCKDGVELNLTKIPPIPQPSQNLEPQK